MEGKNIYQRLNDVMKIVTTVNKENKKVNGQYRFVSHDAVSSLLHEPLTTAGIHMTPTCLSFERDGNRVTVTVELKFVNIDNPTDFVALICHGDGIDPQDKGFGKAMSYAVKTGMLKMFMLEAGEEDNEHVLIDHKPAVKKAEVANALVTKSNDPTPVGSFKRPPTSGWK